MTFYKTKIDGSVSSFEESGFRTVDFVVESPSFSFDEKVVNSITGTVPTQKTRLPRKISVTFSMLFADWIDFAMMRQRLYDLVANSPLYLIEERKQGEMWECYPEDGFSIPQLNMFSKFTIDFTCFAGKSMAIGTTTQKETFTKLDYYNLPTTVDDYKSIEKVVFKIFNPGLEIDPRNRNAHFKVIYKGVSNNFSVTNLTTHETYEHYGFTGEDDTLIIDGINSFKNGKSVFLDTNKKLITLAHGWNEIVLQGVPNAVDLDDLKEFVDVAGEYPITFDFRFNFN